MDANGVNIRQATYHDAAAIIQLDQLCFDQDQFSARQWQYLLKSASVFTWVLHKHQEEKLLGAAVVLIRRNSKNARLYSFAIHPEARRQSYAKQLHHDIVHFLKMRHHQSITLEVRANNFAARQFYENIGYQPSGTILNYYPDGTPAIKMRLNIHP